VSFNQRDQWSLLRDLGPFNKPLLKDIVLIHMYHLTSSIGTLVTLTGVFYEKREYWFFLRDLGLYSKPLLKDIVLIHMYHFILSIGASVALQD